MRLVLQRVVSSRLCVVSSSSSPSPAGETAAAAASTAEKEERVVSETGPGLVAYVGISRDDTDDDAKYCARKLLGLRLWDDAATGRRWDKSVCECGFELLLVSQFTLFAIAKGNKVDHHLAMAGDPAHRFFEAFVARVRAQYAPERVKTGVFGAHMRVEAAVDGPVTIIIDSKQR